MVILTPKFIRLKKEFKADIVFCLRIFLDAIHLKNTSIKVFNDKNFLKANFILGNATILYANKMKNIALSYQNLYFS